MYQLIVLLLFVFCEQSSANQLHAHAKEDAEYVLQKAKYFLSSDPMKTHELLNRVHPLSQQPEAFQIRWSLLKLRATVATNQLSEGHTHLAYLFSLSEGPTFKKELPSILSITGIWLRKSHYLAGAKTTLLCALKQPTSSIQKMAMTISLAVIARQQEDYSQARALYLEASHLAEKLDNRRAMATIANNLGVIELDLGHLELANTHFRNALAGHQLSTKKSGHINSGINLLLVFLLQKQFLNYQRLFNPIEKLTESFPDHAQKAYIYWVQSAYRVEQKETLTPQEKSRLITEFYSLESRGLKRLIKKHLATRLNIEVDVPPQEDTKKLKAAWFKKIKQCAW